MIGAPDALEIDKVLARPEDRAPEALRGSLALRYAGHRLGKGIPAGLAIEASLSDLEIDHLVAHGRVPDRGPSPVIDRGAQGGALRAYLRLRGLLAVIKADRAVLKDMGENFEFRQKQRICYALGRTNSIFFAR